MFVIFGWREGETEDIGPTLLIDCPNCHNRGYWHLHKSKKWFSLFFIPVLAYQTNHRLLCNICSRGIELHGAEIQAALDLKKEAAQVIQGNIGESQLLQSAERAGLLKRAMSIVPKLNNASEGAGWSRMNEELVNAVLKSNTHPQIGIDKIKEILAGDIDINAKNDSGWTALAIANYYEAPQVVRALLINAGAKDA